MTGRSRCGPEAAEPGETRLGAVALLRRAGDAGAARAGPHLLVREPGAPERVVALTSDCTVGRDPGAAVRLGDPSASRLHLRFSLDQSGVCAEDLGSRNGLTVNGGRSRGPRRLRSGDELTVGETLLRYVDPMEGPAAAPGQPPSRAPAPSLLVASAGLLLLAALALAFG